MASSQSHLKTLFVTQYHFQKSAGVVDVSCIKGEEVNHNHRSIFSWFPIRGLKLFSIGWLASKEHVIENRGRSIVFSASGENIAVLVKNEITILRKEDNFTKAFRTFTALPESKLLLHGVWVDHWKILVVSDSSDTIYFLKLNEVELKKISECHLQEAGSIVGLFLWEDRSAKLPDRYSIMVITSDCIFQWIVLNEENSSVHLLNSKATQQLKLKRQHPLGISCCCFHKELSILVLAGPTNEGLYCLSVWRLTNTSDIELICSSSELKGVLTFPKRHSGPFSAPKVVISSCGRHLGMLDLTGSLHILTLEGNLLSVCEISVSDDNRMEISVEGRNTVSLDGIIDFAWWSKGKLMVAKSNGIVNLIEIPSANNLLEDSPRFSSPVLVRNPSSQGHVFVLDNVFPQYQSEESSESFHQVTSENVQDGAKISRLLKNRGSEWKLVSLLEQSVPEMYRFLIDSQKYKAALHFAMKHGFDKDEVLKSQWLHSDYGREAVQNILSSIRDRSWVLSECMDKIGSTVDAVHAILSYGLSETEYYRFQETQIADYNIVCQFRVRRLRLLQYNDRLETFLGVNMGRFSSQEYAVFRRRPLGEIAINLAGSGKIGPLNLLFKRHIFSLAPSILRILDAVPETIPVHNYSQLLPGLSPPNFAPAVREEDWVENQEMMSFIESHWQDKSEEIDLRMSTEHMVKLHSGLLWPSAMEIIQWYKERARTIDKLSGQLENCLSLLDIGYRKGVVELKALFEDVSDLCHLIFSGGDMEERELDLSLSAWEHLCDYEKFKAMLNGVTETTVVERLRGLAVPFMHRKYDTKKTLGEGDSSRNHSVKSVDCSETFLVKWLKDKAEDNNLELCSVILEEGCNDSEVNWLFKDEVEMMEVGLYCIYACTLTDRWGLMASILSKLRKRLSRHPVGGQEDIFHTKGLRRGLERVLRSSYSSVSSNAKLTMSPLFLDEQDSSQSSVSRSHDAFGGQEKEDTVLENLDKRLRLAEGHVEVGRLLTYYQVPKPIVFFLNANVDQKEVKQLLHLVLSKFGRCQPERSDNEWATMWRDMQCFQEKAFPFLDLEYMLLEFCRGLLKAGKFSLAWNYLKGTASMGLAPEKAEMIVIQAAREYFFSASSLDSSDIRKAKECLALFPSSKLVKAEADVIDAITIKLPRLGVTLLPMQFRQIRNPMEIVRMAMTSKTGAYLKAGELIEVARLLGLNSPDDIATVEEAIAREGGATGDLQLALDLCLLLVRKDHGPIWDLCAALGRGPDLGKLDLRSHKELLGFALSHCDVESVGELLHAWKEIDLASQCENLGNSLGKKAPTLSDQKALIGSFPIKSREEVTALIESSGESFSETLQEGQDEKNVFQILRDALPNVTKKFSQDREFDWDVLLKESKRFMSFATLQLPWLLELSRTTSVDPNNLQDIGLPIFTRECSSIHARAAAVILYWLASNNTVPNDSLIINFAKTAMGKPISQEDDMLGCSYLFNLSDPHLGVEVIDEARKTRKEYHEVQSAINIGLIYSSLQARVSEHLTPKQRRKLLLNKFWESQPTDSDCRGKKEEAETTFWKEWSFRIKEQQKLADQARNLEQIIPGVEASRFLSGDTDYIQRVVFSLTETVKVEKKSVLTNGLNLANIYGVKRSEVLVRYLSSLLVSQLWTNEEIEAEISEHWNELLEHGGELLKVLSSTVYTALDASNKERLRFLYEILSALQMHMKESFGPECVSSVADTENLTRSKNELLNFLRTMITTGCSFRVIAEICFQGRENIISDTSLKSDDHMVCQEAIDKYKEKLTAIRIKDADKFPEIHEAYETCIDSILWEIHSQVSKDSAIEINKLTTRRLCNLLSSLSCIYYGDDEVNAFEPTEPHFIVLQRVRQAVWSKLSIFAEDMQLPKQVRVYALELLQCIAGKGCVQAFGVQDNSLLPWDRWDAFHYLDVDIHSRKENKSNVHGFKIALVSLKSTELIYGLWKDVEVNGEDLVTVDSAVSLFCALAAHAVSKPHLSALESLLKLWEALFENEDQRTENEETQEATEGQDDWNGEVEWGDGWGAFQEPKEETGEKPNRVPLAHTFHICWMIILKQLIEQCQLEDVLRLLDETSSNKRAVLLTEGEAWNLTSMLANIQPAVALKSAFLFPYDSLWFEILKLAEDKIKQTYIYDMKEQQNNVNEALDDRNILGDVVDLELLALILYAGILPSLAENPAFATIFSCMCTSVGRLARLLQEIHLCIERSEDQTRISRLCQQRPIFFGSVALPYFIAELTRGKHYFLSGALVFQFMHVHTVFNSMNSVYFVLRAYLEKQIKADEVKYQYAVNGMAFPRCLKNTVDGLQHKLPSVLKLAYSALSEDLRQTGLGNI